MTSVLYEARRWSSFLSPAAAAGSRLLQAARTQLWYKALDAIVTAPARPRTSLGAALRLLLDPRQAHYDRVGALASAADHLLPRASRRLARALLQPEALPFPEGQVELLAYGSGGTAFLLTQGERRWVLKIYRRSLGLNGPGLAAMAREFQQKVATVSRWYDGDAVQLVAPVDFLLVHSPLRRVPALASLQRYLPLPHRDLLAGFSGGELLALAQQEPNFRRQLVHFVHTTLRVYQEQGRCLDFVGAGNVLVVEDKGQHRIVILDYGIFDRDVLARRPRRAGRVEERLQQLRALQTALAGAGLWEGQPADG